MSSKYSNNFYIDIEILKKMISDSGGSMSDYLYFYDNVQYFDVEKFIKGLGSDYTYIRKGKRYFNLGRYIERLSESYLNGVFLRQDGSKELTADWDVGGYAIENLKRLVINDDALLVTPQPGAIEYSNDRFYITNVSVQRAIDRTSDVITSSTTVSNTISEETIWTGTLGPDYLKQGNTLKVIANGNISNDSASDDITLRKYIGSTLLEEFKPAIGNVTNAYWSLSNLFTVRSTGATGSVAFFGHMEIDGNTDTDHSIETLDTTVAEDITITAQWDNAKATNVIDIYQGFLEFKN